MHTSVYTYPTLVVPTAHVEDKEAIGEFDIININPYAADG